ncbi:serine hydroxymethyltransferase [Prochlorococcus marinus]|uniref:serine hydroxymethyltransferase n=1 Tax=Prochlorococcus marinus TaxID=1219 RepID=UPI000533A4AC|nr:serine hydroxymethyltransferase [Prochlorococcus marinus]KGG11852.1 putative Serine hydroxymethyltransferase [Prochlorococcus marinus str. LG]
MLEFILFLDASEKKILDLVQKANYQVEENTPLCLIGQKFFGFLKKQQRKVVICTENAKRDGGYNFIKDKSTGGSFKTGLMIRRALRHESVHIAQECNNGKLINIFDKKKLKISPYKLEALRASTELTGELDKEYEAYAMEDNPKKIISALKKFCFVN